MDAPQAPQALQAALRLSAGRAISGVYTAVLLPALAGALWAGWGAGFALALALWCTLGALLMAHGLRAGGHPYACFGAANSVTLARLALAGVLAGVLGQGAWAAWGLSGPLGTLGTLDALDALDALGAPGAHNPSGPAGTPAALAWGLVALAAVAAALDAVDGVLARRSGLASAFGARFDMETDAAFTLLLCALVWQAGQAGPWVLAAGLMRYAFVAAAAAWPWLGAPLLPSRRRQAVCVVQIASLVVCLAPVVPPAGAALLAAASLGLLSMSFAIDVHHLAQARRLERRPA